MLSLNSLVIGLFCITLGLNFPDYLCKYFILFLMSFEASECVLVITSPLCTESVEVVIFLIPDEILL